jgi:predicted SnoaL-like aldol condensation-catalyzing enzyme
LALAALLASATGAAQLPVEVNRNQTELLPSADATLAANKKLAFDFWREVIQAHHVERASDFVAEGYVEHDPNGATLIEGARQLEPAPVKDAIDDLVTLVAEGNLVVLAFRRTLPDLEHEGQTYTTTWFEMFRVADGKIAERWNFGPEQ